MRFKFHSSARKRTFSGGNKSVAFYYGKSTCEMKSYYYSYINN